MQRLKLYGPFLQMGFNCLKATEPLRGDSLLFTTQFPGFPGTHLIIEVAFLYQTTPRTTAKIQKISSI